MMSRDIFKTTRQKLQPVFVIEQDSNSPYYSLSGRKQAQNQKIQIEGQPPMSNTVLSSSRSQLINSESRDETISPYSQYSKIRTQYKDPSAFQPEAEEQIDGKAEPEAILKKVIERAEKVNIDADWLKKSYEDKRKELDSLSDYEVVKRIEAVGEAARRQDQQLLILQRQLQEEGLITIE